MTEVGRRYRREADNIDIIRTEMCSVTVTMGLQVCVFFTLLKPSGHYMYHTPLTVCTAQRSLYLPHTCHCMYRTAVTICTAHRSLYVPHSGHYIYRTPVTVCTAQRSLYVPHTDHYMYRTPVTVCATNLTFSNSTFCPHRFIYVFCVDLRTNSHYFPIQH